MPKLNTSAQILDTAQELVQSRGYNAFSYADISEVVGIRKASIHYHFPTKAQLGQALVKRYRDAFIKDLDQIRAEAAPADRQLLQLAEIYADHINRDLLCLCDMLAADALAIPAEVREAVTAFFAEIETWIAETIAQGCEAGLLACDDPTTMAKAVLSTLAGTELIARANQWGTDKFTQTVACQLESLKI